MADHGEAALRLVDPTWATIRATVRLWTDHRPMTEFLGRSDVGRPMRPSVVSGIAPGSAPTETEEFVRIWRSGRDRERFEHASSPASPAHLSIYDDGATRVIVHSDGSGRRVPKATNYGISTPIAWTGDPDLVLGLVNVRFTASRTWMGRAVDDATTDPALTPRRALGRYGPMLGGFVIAAPGRLTVDRSTGLVVRYEVRDEDDRPFFVAEFLDLVVDEPVSLDTFRYVPPPGKTIRGAYQDLLDHAVSDGVDVSGIDPDDPGAQRLLDERRGHGGSVARMPPPAEPQPLSALIAPLGPPPADVDVARAEIEAAVAGLSSDSGRSAVDCIERGDIVDAQPPAPVHPVVGDQEFSWTLRDLAFIREDEAIIEFEIRLSGGMGPMGFKGRAVRRDGRWLVSYDTWANLQQMGGVSPPSLLDHPEEGP